MLVVDPSCDWTVVAASRNAIGMLNASSSADPSFAGPSSADGVIGCSIGSILGLHFAEAVQSRFQGNRLRGGAPWQSTLRMNKESQAFDVAVHGHAGLILVEMEPAGAKEEDAQTVIRQHQEIIVDLRETGSDLEDLALVTARGVRLLTGYERVVIYRFDADWNGQAIVEDKVADWDNSLSGLRFPASDIPAQARELYRHSPMRWVADRDATPVPLDINPAWTGDPLLPRAIDLSFAYLRTLSPVHMQIHRNLGINGSMSLSIMQGDRLWGLVICHHRPAAPPFLQPAAGSLGADQRLRIARRARRTCRDGAGQARGHRSAVGAAGPNGSCG